MKKIHTFLLAICALLVSAETMAQSWGDQHDGTFKNPVIASDYSDPDVIRVGNKYYMVASDFHFLGMQILESEDLVNWRVVTQLYHCFELPGWNENRHYAGGSWAPAIRYHNNRFYVFFCTPDEGLFMTTAEKAEGPWEPLHIVKAVPKWEDPCPFWDEDGQAYLGHSVYGAGPIILHKMSADGKQLLDEGVTIYEGPVAEGTKIHKWNGYYYLSIPEGGVDKGWQTILRSRNIYGPYERKIVLEKGSTDVNGPHQGAIVDTSEGSWWFMHFQERHPMGRIVHLQPVKWEDGWPVMGVDYDGNGVGEPVPSWKKPLDVVTDNHIETNDDFDGPSMKPIWQWNHNPLDEAWSLTEKKGKLVLHALKADHFFLARNTLTQKTQGFKGTATVTLDYREIAQGSHCGLACMGKEMHLLGIKKTGKSLCLYVEKNGEEEKQVPIKGKKVYLRLQMDASSNTYHFEYSRNGKTFNTLGEPFAMRNGFWKGARVALYHYNNTAEQGTAVFDDFIYVHD